jgi:hypothetical protein
MLVEAIQSRIVRHETHTDAEGLAEDGDPSGLYSYVEKKTGITQIIAPGVWTLHTKDDVLFISGEPDGDEGLEALAEDGDPSTLAANLAGKDGVRSSGVFNTPVGSGSPGPVTPGNSYQFTFTAKKGDKLSFATMFVQSNDLFYAPNGSGIELIKGHNLVMGDITDRVFLWDAGTEVNEKPGFGPNQAPRQSGPNTGTDENGNVMFVNDSFQYPLVSDVIKVSITRQ